MAKACWGILFLALMSSLVPLDVLTILSKIADVLFFGVADLDAVSSFWVGSRRFRLLGIGVEISLLYSCL